MSISCNLSGYRAVWRGFRWSILLLVLAMAACQGNAETPGVSPSPTELPTIVTTPIPTAQLAPTHTPTLPPSPTPTVTPLPTDTPVPTSTPPATDTPAPSVTPTLAMVDHYEFDRPILRTATNNKVDWADRTYPYGGTQFNARQVHLGVDFVNTRFTPVLAAGDGTVYYAGSDSETQFGPSTDYYGNVIVIAHPFLSPEGLPVYTLYGHLQVIEVQTGDTVHTGEEIGKVGDAGVAIGPHLHFEVRLGNPTDFNATRNPDLWIKPYPGFGTLAGLVTDADGNVQYGVTLTVRSDKVQRETYTYGDDSVHGDAVWRENFTLGDLPADDYEVIIGDGNGHFRFRQTVTITAGHTTRIEIVLQN